MPSLFGLDSRVSLWVLLIGVVVLQTAGIQLFFRGSKRHAWDSALAITPRIRRAIIAYWIQHVLSGLPSLAVIAVALLGGFAITTAVVLLAALLLVGLGITFWINFIGGIHITRAGFRPRFVLFTLSGGTRTLYVFYQIAANAVTVALLWWLLVQQLEVRL